jgi:hypothetical protein
MMQRLERLEELASSAGGSKDCLILGPLRRDLAKLMALENPKLRQGAEELDRKIVALLSG